jgi:hypothetical protein
VAEQDRNVREALEGLDEGKRETLSRLIGGSAFVAPVVASFAMQGLSIRPAEAQTSGVQNGTTISDARLKTDIAPIGTHPMGFGIYRFKYLWSNTFNVGVLAHEVLEKFPEAVTIGPGDFLAVDYGAIVMAMTRDGARAH